MFATAGIVVTEMSTPMSAPDFAVLRESIPAAPAQRATKNEKKSGEAMIDDRLWSACVKCSGVKPVVLKTSEATSAATTASGRPTASAANERAASLRGPFTIATQKPATGPNSGPTT